MSFVIVRVECHECGKHKGTMVSIEGRENELTCFYCQANLKVVDTIMKIGRK